MKRGATLNLIGAAVSGFSTLAVTVVVTRSFGRPVAGAFFAAISLMLMGEAVGNLGAYNGVIYFVARARATARPAAIPVVLRKAFAPVAVASILCTALMVVFAGPFASGIGAGAASLAEHHEVVRMVRVLAFAVPFAALADTLLGATRGFRAMWPTVFVDRFGRSIGQLIGVLIAAVVGSATLLAPLSALPYLPAAGAGAFCLAWVLRRSARQAAHETSPSERRAESPRGDVGRVHFWRFTAPRSVASVAQMLIQRLDIVLVALIRGPVAAAIYTAATRFLVVGQLGNTAITMAAQPQFAHLFAQSDRRGVRSAYQATTAWLMLLTWPLYLLVIIFGPAVLALFGHGYRAGTSVIVVLGVAMLIATACGQVDTVLMTAGRSGWSLANGLLALGVNVSVDLLLIPRYGIKGAAIGWAAAIVTSNLVPLVQVAAVLRVHPFGRPAFLAAALSTVSFGVIPVACRLLGGESAGAAVAAVLVGAAVMAAGTWRLRDALGLGRREGRLTVLTVPAPAPRESWTSEREVRGA